MDGGERVDEEFTKLVMNPDSDDDSNNNNASVNVNNYFDNNKSRDSSLEHQQPILDGDQEEDEETDVDGSGEPEEDYSDYEEDIEEFPSSGDDEGVISVHNTSGSPVNSTSGSESSTVDTTVDSVPLHEQLVQPDQIQNVVDESSATASGISTATEIVDETYDWPRTEALIGIRPYSEGSGNGRSNDDEDDDDYDDDEEEIKARKRVKNARENAERGGSRRFNNYNGNVEEDSEEDGSSRYLKNRRYGKNNAIKFISTPHGKVGILYSSGSDDAKKSSGGSSSSSSSSGSTADTRKDSFRGISSDLRPILISNPDSRSSEDRGGSSSSGGKMTPVLTADGKVALLYRGASAENENVAKKYEPIVNYTKPAVPVTQAPPPQEPNFDLVDEDGEEELEQEKKESERELVKPKETKEPFQFPGLPFEKDFAFPTNTERHNSVSDRRDPEDSAEHDGAMMAGPYAPPPPPKLDDNNFLPILDRPLSELLGLKKHQFTHFRVTEPAPTTAVPQVNMRGKLPSNYDYDFGGDYNGVSDQEILTKTEVVNLAIVPSVQDHSNSVVQHKGNANFRKHRPFRFEDLSNVHCATQFVVGLAALCCIFGMVGAYFRNRFLDTQVPAYRL